MEVVHRVLGESRSGRIVDDSTLEPTVQTLVRSILVVSLSLLAVLALTGALFLGGPVLAKGKAAVDLTADKELARDGGDLQVDIRDAIDRDTDVADSALVFTNTGDTEGRVVCRAIDGNGQAVGSRTGVTVPAGGVRYLRASDISDGADFVGRADCVARRPMIASGFFLAPGAITDLKARREQQRRHVRMHFPVVATY